MERWNKTIDTKSGQIGQNDLIKVQTDDSSSLQTNQTKLYRHDKTMDQNQDKQDKELT